MQKQESSFSSASVAPAADSIRYEVDPKGMAVVLGFTAGIFTIVCTVLGSMLMGSFLAVV